MTEGRVKRLVTRLGDKASSVQAAFSKPPPVNYATKPRPQASIARTTPASSLFAPIGHDTAEPVSYYKARKHTLKPKGITSADQSGCPIQTNKFYSNLYLGDQRQPAYVLPYSVKFSDSGLDISHTERSQHCFGPDSNAQTAQYCFAPVGIVSLCLGAAEGRPQLQLTKAEHFSIQVSLVYGKGQIVIPLVAGSAFLSASYECLTPTISSHVMFRSVQEVAHARCQKWRLILEDGRIWLAYWHGPSLVFDQKSNGLLSARTAASGLLQLVKRSTETAEAVFDDGTGCIVHDVALDGTVSGKEGSYSFSFQKSGTGTPLVFALPHQVDSFGSDTLASCHPVHLDSQIKGAMTLVQADKWIMHEMLPSSNQLCLAPKFRHQDTAAIQKAIQEDSCQDFDAGCRAPSMYFGGKALAKLAQVALLAHQTQHTAAPALIEKFERNLMMYVDNQQLFPLVYDQTWGGLVSVQGFNGDPMADFGNTWYNDHMFHYGYHVFAAAVFLTLLPSSSLRGRVCRFAESLLQDFMNPVASSRFPAFRSFDWFAGHSWAKGLFESTDGKDEESSSEDAFATFAAFLYGRAAGLQPLADLAQLMLAVQKRSMNHYMLFSSDNACMPPKIIGNKVSGILFNNKVDYATYFGANKEYIHGIHMIPLSPISTYIRSRRFVQEEWQERVQQLSRQCAGGWRGILWANYAAVDAEAAWHFFTCNFDRGFLDDGASLSWYLAYVSSLR